MHCMLSDLCQHQTYLNWRITNVSLYQYGWLAVNKMCQVLFWHWSGSALCHATLSSWRRMDLEAPPVGYGQAFGYQSQGGGSLLWEVLNFFWYWRTALLGLPDSSGIRFGCFIVKTSLDSIYCSLRSETQSASGSAIWRINYLSPSSDGYELSDTIVQYCYTFSHQDNTVSYVSAAESLLAHRLTMLQVQLFTLCQAF